MGCDGGTIPKRDELVKTKKQNRQVDKTEQLIANWYYCALSKTPLKEPIVSCRLGKLYNKDAIIKYLLNKKAYGDGDRICKHITSIKVIKKKINNKNIKIIKIYISKIVKDN